MTTHTLPPFSTVVKSREVEDPINLWLHRPLAYAFVALIFRTSITPNQVTLMALAVGVASAPCFIIGTPPMMVAGGLLLWSSAILDGADGILARAKQAFSDLGRALDGSADAVVSMASVGAVTYHLWVVHQSASLLAVLLIALAPTLVQIVLYDFYKESYLQMTNPNWDGKSERPAELKARLARLKAEGTSWVAIQATQMYIDMTGSQDWAIRLTNPLARRDHLSFQVSQDSVDDHRRFNLGPMRVWTALSLAPHTYIMSMCAIFDRLDVYVWLRAIVANALFIIVLLWQRRATRRTRNELERRNQAPVPA